MGAYAVSKLLNAIDEGVGMNGEARRQLESRNKSINESEFEKVVFDGQTALFAPSLVIRDSVAAPRNI
jgi:hypothetical protein